MSAAVSLSRSRFLIKSIDKFLKPSCYKRYSNKAHAPFKHRKTIFVPTATGAEKPDPTKLVFGQTFTDHMLTAEWNDEKGWNDPKIGPVENFSIHPAASVFHYSIELFEGLKAYKGKDGKTRLFRPDMNCKRLNKSAEYSCMPQIDNDELLKCIIELIKLEKDWVPDSNKCPGSSLYIRPTMIGINASLGVNKATKALFYVILSPVGPYFKKEKEEELEFLKPVSLYSDPSFVRSWPGGIGATKLGANYGPTIRTQKAAEDKGHQQVLWLFGEDQQLTEVGTMNLFVHWINEDGELEIATPPLDGLILPGVTRDSILEITRTWGTHKVTERKITLEDTRKAIKEERLFEMFGTGTACVVCPIDKMQFLDEIYDIPTDGFKGSKVAERAYKELTDIQYGVTPHESWTIVVD